ncbi:FAD-dependent oxidoreductase family protein [Wolffia australiana]
MALDGRFWIRGGALWRRTDVPSSASDLREGLATPIYLRRSSSAKSVTSSACCLQPLRYAVLGAGFAGLSVVWHLLESNPKELSLVIDLFDEVGIGGGASGVAGGLIHPYSPKGKLLWRGPEFWKECLKLLSVAEKENSDEDQIVWRRGIIRPATTPKNAEILKENASNLPDGFCNEFLGQDATQKLVPGLRAPYDASVYMPHAVNIHPSRYLQALFLACKNLSEETSMQIRFFKKRIKSLLELQDDYDCVIICLGAKATMLPELEGLLPLRLCRGVIAHMQLPDSAREAYEERSPSILSDAWLAAQGPRTLVMGSTWDWGSENSSPDVSPQEECRALEELIPKVVSVYPAIEKWSMAEMKGGLRAMPPLTSAGSLPLLGCVDDFVKEKGQAKYWIIGGLGARGLLYHGLLGKLTAQAVVLQDEGFLPSELISWKKLHLKPR